MPTVETKEKKVSLQDKKENEAHGIESLYDENDRLEIEEKKEKLDALYNKQTFKKDINQKVNESLDAFQQELENRKTDLNLGPWAWTRRILRQFSPLIFHITEVVTTLRDRRNELLIQISCLQLTRDYERVSNLINRLSLISEDQVNEDLLKTRLRKCKKILEEVQEWNRKFALQLKNFFEQEDKILCELILSLSDHLDGRHENANKVSDPISPELHQTILAQTSTSNNKRDRRAHAQFTIAHVVMYYSGFGVNDIKKLTYNHFNDIFKNRTLTLIDSKKNISREIVFTEEAMKDFEKIELLIHYLFQEEGYYYLGDSFKKRPQKNTNDITQTNHTNDRNHTNQANQPEDTQNTMDIVDKEDSKDTEAKKEKKDTEKKIDTSMGEKSWIRFINTNIKKISKKMPEEKEANYGSASYRLNSFFRIKKFNTASLMPPT